MKLCFRDNPIKVTVQVTGLKNKEISVSLVVTFENNKWEVSCRLNYEWKMIQWLGSSNIREG